MSAGAVIQVNSCCNNTTATRIRNWNIERESRCAGAITYDGWSYYRPTNVIAIVVSQLLTVGSIAFGD